MAAPSPVSASLSWMPSRLALLLRESSRARRFLRLTFVIAGYGYPVL
jgi:hypothetical protein